MRPGYQVILHPPLGPVSGQLVPLRSPAGGTQRPGPTCADTAAGSPLPHPAGPQPQGPLSGVFLRGLWRRLGELVSHMVPHREHRRKQAGGTGAHHRFIPPTHQSPRREEEPTGRGSEERAPRLWLLTGLCALSARGSHGLLWSGVGLATVGAGEGRGFHFRRAAFHSVADGTGSL